MSTKKIHTCDECSKDLSDQGFITLGLSIGVQEFDLCRLCFTRVCDVLPSVKVLNPYRETRYLARYDHVSESKPKRKRSKAKPKIKVSGKGRRRALGSSPLGRKPKQSKALKKLTGKASRR